MADLAADILARTTAYKSYVAGVLGGNDAWNPGGARQIEAACRRLFHVLENIAEPLDQERLQTLGLIDAVDEETPGRTGASGR